MEEIWTGVKVERPSAGRRVIVWGRPEGSSDEYTWTMAELGGNGGWYESYSLVPWTVLSWMVPSGPGF